MPTSSRALAPSAGSHSRSTSAGATKPSSALTWAIVPQAPSLASSHHASDVGVGAHPHGLGEEQAAPAGLGHEPLGGRRLQRQCLLAEHGLAGLEAAEHVDVVPAVRRGDVDDVDVGVVGEVAVRGVGTNRRRRAGILLRERLRRLRGARTDRHQHVVRHECEVAGEAVGDLAGREDAPAHRRRRHGRHVDTLSE